ncbi:hypothetical protein AWZ03_009797 [Drosophila navojoa]|uniref:Uncharacterized protein n=1 Tax=Drosophila navojoa TaxID=7232 RepID=A0A484B4H9_DRONA|nr:hypothetical protein AWZ03_009797 [Drosophila navojoa]
MGIAKTSNSNSNNTSQGTSFNGSPCSFCSFCLSLADPPACRAYCVSQSAKRGQQQQQQLLLLLLLLPT